ncbi:MAG: dihydrofolate reductase [Chloroflexi bacterium]|nr:dihydrofolate reductase [Chloroflexota bacterium]
MKISLIVAMDEANGIGVENCLPWRLSSDLRRFKQLTMGHHLVMGRKTYQSIGGPLPGREMIILSRNSLFRAPGCQVVTSLGEALNIAAARGETELFIAGGAEIYRQALPQADCIYLTRVHVNTPVDTRFPEFNLSNWAEVSAQRVEADTNNEYTSTYSVLVRVHSP